jgi:4-amino-4-deoxy-L-arabinose transferase-like glycosyltransferase
VREEGLTPPPWRLIALTVAVKIGLTMAVAGRYGWHRDELYYLASSKHLAFGYVDYPPMTPLLAAADQLIFPRSLPGLRLLTILAGAAVIVIAALIARELGGNQAAQSLAGLAVLISPMFVGANILFQTVSFDQLTWAIVCLLFVRLLNGAPSREWLLLGLAFGIGLETKFTIIGLGVAILGGLLLTRQRRALATRWPWLAFLIAMVLLAPNIAWQATHHWDSVQYTLNHRGATDGPLFYWLQQLLLAGPQLLPIVAMGVVWLWRRERFRAAAITVIAVEIVFFFAGGKAYYPAPIFPLTYAAGSIWLVTAVRSSRGRVPLVALACVVSLILLPLGLPVIPAQNLPQNIWTARKDYSDMVGWPELTQEVTAVYQHLPAGERQSTMILTNNYGEAGALELYGHGLPTVVCPELTFYYWAPAQMNPSTLIIVGFRRDYVESFFGKVRQVGTVSNSLGIHNEEWGKAIWLVQQPRQSLRQAWPQLQSLD